MSVTVSPELARRRAVLWVHNILSKPMLETSTGHVPKHTADALGLGRQTCAASPLSTVLSYEPWGDYGWIIWVTEISDLPDGFAKQHPELAALLTFAGEQGFRYLKLDCEGERLPKELGFPVLEW